MEEKEIQKIDFKHNLKMYWQIARRYKFAFVFIILLVTVMEGARLIEKFLFKTVIDRGTEFATGAIARDPFVSAMLIAAAIFIGVSIFRSAGQWLHLHLLNKLETSVIMDLKTKFFNHIVHLSHRFHTTHKTGSMISRLNRGSRAVEVITDFFIMNLAPLVLEIALLGGSILFFDRATAISIVVTSALFIGFSLYIINRQKEASIRANNAEDREKGLISDVFANIDSIKYFGKEKNIKQKYAQHSAESRATKIKHWNYYRNLEAGQVFILAIGTFCVVYFPILGLLEGRLTIGTVAFMYTAYGSLMGPMFGFVWGIRRFFESMADFNSLFEYDKIQNEIKDAPYAQQLKVRHGKISYNNVSFKYYDKNVLSNISLDIQPGEKVALVGHSGSGKTTLVKLLYRLYEPTKGAITIDGKDIKDFKQESLRSEFSIVPQECILFDDTIYNNILFSRPNATRDEVLKAIKAAQLDKFIAQLPKKENTIVGERGVKLSGGEKQRVSIARAILANKKVLVLDEATSALDSKTEFELQSALKRLMQGRTSIVIAHRLSTIMSADKIVVMDHGKIVQVGRHRELITQPGVYRELWNLQKGGYIEE